MTSGDRSSDGSRPFVFEDSGGRISDPHRLERLRSTGLLSARPRPALDAITRLAAELTGARAAYVTLIGADRRTVVGAHVADGNHEAIDMPLSRCLCQYVVINDAPLYVGDATSHTALSSHPAVLDGTVVAYAGFPVRAPGGEALGALSVVDGVGRSWTAAQLAALEDLAEMVDTKVALGLSRREVALDRERLMHVLDGATHTPIIVADGAGVIGTTNAAARAALGLAGDEVGPMTLADLASAHEQWRPGGLDGTHEWSLLDDGRQQIFSVRVSTLLGPEGEMDGYVLVGDDVSARRQAEELLRTTVQEQAEAVDRLKAFDAQRGAFISSASHELRTPVASILGYTEMLADGEYGEITSAQRTLVGRLARSGRRLNHLIDDLLSWDRIEFEHHGAVRSEIDVQQLTGRAWDRLQELLVGRDLHATIEVPLDIPHVFGQGTQLERALFHVLSNAVKFTPDGCAIRLSVGADGPGVRFEVSDTGPGIPEAAQEGIFAPFFRIGNLESGAAHGTGLGLDVVRRIVESHGGEISLTSALGRGTAVTFTIPVSEPVPQPV